MASLQPHLLCSLFSPTSRSTKLLLPTSTLAFTSTSTSTHPALYLFPAKKLKLPTSRYGTRSVFCFFSKSHDAASQISTSSDSERPPFDINLAVILAGFAFEAYTTPPDNIGVKELDAAGCQTVYLSESFLREIYDGQLLVKLKKGMSFPAMDPWGTSDPYVVLQLDAQVVNSKVKWGTKDPTWNEEFTINIKQDPTKSLQVAAWDANLVTPHKRMGNGRINLEGIFDGNPHEMLVELEGIGGGGRIQLEIKYRSFHDIDEEKKWWDVPFLSEFLRKNGLAAALASVIGPGSMPAGQFVQYAFWKLKSFNDERLSNDQKCLTENNEDMDIKSNKQLTLQSMPSETDSNAFSANANSMGTQDSHQLHALEQSNVQLSKLATQFDAAMHSDFWKNFSDAINQNVVQKLGLPAPENLKWDGFELLNQIGLQSKNIAEAGYVESGLATPDNPDMKNGDESGGAIKFGNIQASLPDIKKTMQEVLRQTDSVFGALIVLSAEKPQSNEKRVGNEIRNVSVEKAADVPEYLKERLLTEVTEGVELDEKKAEEMKALFTTAETAMEAWAMLASAVGHPSFVKSEFEKLCFLDNASTDTQVALWRDSARRRLVVAFRGTEQARWKDLMTDLMLVPAGLNPERIGGDFKQEVQVHSGFLGAYDSVRTRLESLVKLSIGFASDNEVNQEHNWKVYITGHSLGGALATLLALELSSSQLAKRGAISVTMYNFGSPRVGNRRFAEVYNEKVRDSWRVVNHRDIIPTVPRLMGYCHVAQPVYLATGGLKNSMENAELLEDGYQIDVVGEYTPDVLVNEFMKGEKELVEKILQTEINLFRSIRDGSALMQHMEDFYYITLLENVRSNYQTVQQPWSGKGDSHSL
ncbi:hypothetical protein QQ045_014988 [Rhodiola kirilowii]